ncbi:MAG: MgtC/SapB family protein [Candidatus Omnitrophota bacterium]
MSFDITSIIYKLLLSIALSGLIGIEREYRHKEAGLRTHILVCVSSTLVVLTSFYVSDIYKSSTAVDPSRLLHGIITGIGFLCAGTIIRSGNQVNGLTTAASVWTVACIGMAVGAGQYFVSVIFTFAVVLVLVGIRSIERIMNRA